MLNLTFRHEYTTTNTYRFEEIDPDTNKPKEKGTWAIGKLYIRKAFFTICPDEITVKVEW